MANQARVIVSDASVSFPLYHGSSRSLKRMAFAAASNRLGSDDHKRIVVRALTGISFELAAGERMGLIGSNGAGKSTLLRLLGGIFEPVTGHVDVTGQVHALLDPSVGMNLDLTGRENIRLRGLYAGLSQAEIAQLEEDVADFAELANFIDLPVRIYSAGMVVRLGFGLATGIRPQIVLMDEWFLAGDYAFMEKARTRLEAMVHDAEILVLSSHQLDVIQQWCTRVLWLHEGRVVADGDPAEVIALYQGGVHTPVAAD